MSTATATHTHCLRCGRALRSLASQTRGYGRHCATKIRHAARDLDGFKPAQLDSAREAIEDGGILPLRDRIFLVVSTDGTHTHRTDARGYCTCPAGIKHRRCWHLAAAQMLLAA